MTTGAIAKGRIMLFLMWQVQIIVTAAATGVAVYHGMHGDVERTAIFVALAVYNALSAALPIP